MTSTHLFKDQEAEAAWRKLRASAEYVVCLESLKGKNRRGRRLGATLEDWISGAVMHGLAELEPFEKMTSKQRQAASKKMVAHCEALRELLVPFYNERTGLDWPFQPYLDRAALESAINYQANWPQNFEDLDEDDREDSLYRIRFSIYHGIRKDLGLVFDAIHNGALHLAELQSEVKKPNDSNVRRLRFIRRLTNEFMREFGTPHRALVLALASVFFETSDMDEAAISKLAPIPKGA
ncbi:hypothetical protein [Stenotrophomonas sp. BIGb0135]|uniref:hypothetical protein n=1 Tax=Stenotrophomonas sp. BIGb0135 TaxID=2940620 RepID=UPI002169E4E9|nr:hypothetical protein [Stenotrophomonas sp. BIGb0135]MCS4236671.1 hypothetical protein [Stenotrophomonas sp. BIGb0135]